MVHARPPGRIRRPRLHGAPRLNRARGPVLGAALVTLLGHLLAITSPAVAEQDPEELYNAGHAWLVAQGHLSDLWALQYRDFCGGCSVDALLGAGLFTLLPPTWLAWKLVSLVWALALAIGGATALRAHSGQRAAWAWVALCAFPPRAMQHLAILSWGNHVEAGVAGALGLLCLLGSRRSTVALAGHLCAFALALSFSGAYAPLAALAFLLVDRRAAQLPAFLAGALTGLWPWLLRLLATGRHPFVTIYEDGESAPLLARVPQKLLTLLRPGQLVALFGDPTAIGAFLALGFVLAAPLTLLAARRQPLLRIVGIGILAWIGVYLLVRFQVSDSPLGAIAVPQSMRYAAPLYPLLLLGLAVGLASLPRAQALPLGALLLLPGLAARKEALQARYPLDLLAQAVAIDVVWFSRQPAYLLPLDAHAACTAADPWSQAVHAIARGRAAALVPVAAPPKGVEPQAWAWGYGEARIEQLDGPGRGEIADLQAAADRLRAELTDPALAAIALRAAISHRLETGALWPQARATHDEAALATTLPAVWTAQPPDLADALAWALGRAWALDLAPFADPRPIAWPTNLSAAPLPFLEGLGAGLGARWGPDAPLPALEGPAATALATGRAQGARLAWITAPG